MRGKEPVSQNEEENHNDRAAVYPYKGGISHYTGLMYRELAKRYDVEMLSYKMLLLQKFMGRQNLVYVCHNVFPHERFTMDKLLTRLVLKHGRHYIVHAKEGGRGLEQIKENPDYVVTPHPTYNAFRFEGLDKEQARDRLGIAQVERFSWDDIQNLLEGVNRLTEKVDRELADSVLEVSIGVNKRIVEELIGDDSMCQALMEIMEPVMQLRDQENVEKGLKKGIWSTIDTLREFGHGDLEIKEAIMRKYDISDKEVEGYL